MRNACTQLLLEDADVVPALPLQHVRAVQEQPQLALRHCMRRGTRMRAGQLPMHAWQPEPPICACLCALEHCMPPLAVLTRDEVLSPPHERVREPRGAKRVRQSPVQRVGERPAEGLVHRSMPAWDHGSRAWRAGLVKGSLGGGAGGLISSGGGNASFSMPLASSRCSPDCRSDAAP